MSKRKKQNIRFNPFDLRAIILLLINLLSIHFATAQILDDSTKQVYSLRTVKYILEDDILNNRQKFYHPDSLLNEFHLHNFILKSGWLYQDLGNEGTAYKSIFYNAPEQIGRQLGFDVFTNYAFDARAIKYFNTKSPYTNMNYIQNGRGTTRLHFTHSQNITERLNATLDVRRLKSSKQYGAPRTREDVLVDNWAFNFSTNYETKNKKYVILANYNHFNHAPNEQGGIQALDGGLLSADTLGRNYKQFLSRLASASSREWWNDLHVYHQYVWRNGLQFYHVLDYRKSINYYTDADMSDSLASVAYYGNIIPENRPDTLFQALTYRLFENKFGVKGFYKGFNYRLHLRQRLYNYKTNYGEINNLKLQPETLVGGWASYYFPDSVRKAFAEVEFGTNLDYSVKVEYVSPRIKAGFFQIVSPSNLIQNRFYSPLLEWDNSFRNTFSNNIYASTELRKGKLTLIPNGQYSIITNYIYYDTDLKPKQTSEAINILKLGLTAELRLKKWTFYNQLFVTTNTKDKYIRIPLIANNLRISYDILYAKVLKIHTGIEVYYKSAYYADNYNPLIRQFHLQNQQKVWGYPVVDAFADLMVNKVRLFFKYNHLNNLAFSTNYYTTPTYPGLSGTLNMGVNWPLFD
ncbi:MAG: putative porin [Spirosomataceae bacterium]